MLAFAIDHHSPATVILVAGDRDYAYAMSTLRLRRYNVVLIVPSANVPESLMSQASVVIDWNYAILRKRLEAGTPPVRQPYPDLDEDTLERLTSEIQGSNGDPAITAHTRVAQPAPTDTPRKAASVSPETSARHRVRSTPSRSRSTSQPTQTVQDINRDSGSGSDGVADNHVSTTNEIQDATHDPFAGPHIMSPCLERHHDVAESPSIPPSPSPSATFDLRSKTPLSHSRTISGGTPISYGNPLPQTTVPTATSASPALTDGRSDTTSALKSTNSSPISAIMDDHILPSDHAAVIDAFELDDVVEDDYNSNESANVSTNSLHLTEVKDNPSHTHAMNAVQLCFNEDQTSFRDIGRSPPINDSSSSISELSETATSQRSSSAPSSSDPNVTMHNVEIGSPPQVMPPVIRHNSDSHFSGYHALPIESIDDRIRRLTPPQFMPLINQLLLARSRGNMKPRSSMIASALVRYGTDVYRRAGVIDFWDYSTQAEKAFLIELGGWADNSWIALHPNLFKEATATDSVEDKIRRLTPLQFRPLIDQLLLARSNGVLKPGRSAIAIALLQCDKDVYKRAGVTKFKDYALLAEQASLVELGGLMADAWIMLHPNLFKEETAAESLKNKTRRLTPPQFLPLIDQLLLARSRGVVKPGRSAIAIAVLQCDKDAYGRAGVTKFKDYALLAEQASLVELGGLKADAWIALHPNLLKEETTPKSLTPPTAHRSSFPASQHTSTPWITSATSLPYATTPNPSTSPLDASDRPIPPCFVPLITCLANIEKDGVMNPLRSQVGLVLGPAIYARAGVDSLKEYLALAANAGVVECGGVSGYAWVRLHRDVLTGRRVF